MKKYLSIISLCFIVLLLTLSSGCKKHSTEPIYVESSDTTYWPPYARKPNIYIYPTSTCSLTVKLQFPFGGTIIKSIPEYLDGWHLNVTPNGRINDKYDYLFYECMNPDMYQYNSGWVVKSDSLQLFFINNLSQTGFNPKETSDFIEYWIPRLVEYPYYIIYPQYSENINKVIQLWFSIKPDKVLRLFYVIKGSNTSNIELKTPLINVFQRNGFVVTEWGVVM